MKTFDVAIIGCGPAGMACAVQLKRYGVEPAIFEKHKIGGLLNNANLVENYPGFTGISGINLIENFKKGFLEQNLDIRRESVLKVSYTDNLFNIIADKNNYVCKILVVASGTVAKTLKFQDSVIDRVFYEVYPLLEEKDRDIVVVGSGDAAFDYAINLSKFNRIKLLNRSNKTKCLPLLFDRVKSIKTINYFENTEIDNVENNGDELKITYKSGQGTEADFILVAIGREPNLEFLNSSIDKNSFNEKGIFYIIGDAGNGVYRQASIAVGDGVKTAMRVHRKLTGRED